MNTHLPAILMFTRGTRVLTHTHMESGLRACFPIRPAEKCWSFADRSFFVDCRDPTIPGFIRARSFEIVLMPATSYSTPSSSQVCQKNLLKSLNIFMFRWCSNTSIFSSWVFQGSLKHGRVPWIIEPPSSSLSAAASASASSCLSFQTIPCAVHQFFGVRMFQLSIQ